MTTRDDIGRQGNPPSVHLTENHRHENVYTECDPLTAYMMKGDPRSHKCDAKAQKTCHGKLQCILFSGQHGEQADDSRLSRKLQLHQIRGIN